MKSAQAVTWGLVEGAGPVALPRRAGVVARLGRFAGRLLFCAGLLLAGFAKAEPVSPFALNATMVLSNQVAWVTFDFRVPPDHVLYADRLAFLDADGNPL